MKKNRKILQLILSAIFLFSVIEQGFNQNLDTANVLSPRYNPDKKIIEFGWGMLYPGQVRDNMASLAQRPFNGLVFRIKWPPYNNRDFPHSIFYPQEVSESYMQLDTLAKIKWSGNLTDNFLHFKTFGPSYADWFDDTQWSTVLENARRISKANAIAGTKGIFLDTEEYGNTMRYKTKEGDSLFPSYTFEQVRAKVRQRGKEFIEALQTHSPGIKVLTTGAWMFPYWHTRGGDFVGLPDDKSALLGSFCDGMLEGAEGRTKIIDGNEIGYYWRSTINWHYSPGAYEMVSDNPLIAEDLRSKSDTNMQVGHGLYHTPYRPVNTEDKIKMLEHHVYTELLLSDEYMWFYTEEPQQFWLNPFPANEAIAIRSAKDKIAAGEALGFTLEKDTIIHNSSDLRIVSPGQNQVFNVGDTISFQTQSVPTVSNITYFTSYKKLKNISNTPAISKSLAVNPGIYLVYAYSNGYRELSNPVTYYVEDNSTTVYQVDDKADFLIYPNPTRSFITIKLNQNINQARLNVFNYQGQKIRSIDNIEGHEIVINRGNLESGLYFLQLKQHHKIITTRKFIIID